jgi:oxidase EvaA
MKPGNLDEAVLRSLVEQHTSLLEITQWLDQIEASEEFVVEIRDLADLENWDINNETGDIGHVSGRFFTIQGFETHLRHCDSTARWHQPLIVQRDIGVLGLITSICDGVFKVLVQAKMEPGNRRLVQISPTVQATSSNFQRIHHGDNVDFLEYFLAAQDQAGYQGTLFDQLQTEQSTRYLRKLNRNMIVAVDATRLPRFGSRFRWVTLADLHELATADDILHMDTRSVLGAMPFSTVPEPAPDLQAFYTWLESFEATTQVDTKLLPLKALPNWHWREGMFEKDDLSPFTVLGVRVSASTREVNSWDQPIIRNREGAISTLFIQSRNGIPSVLVSGMTGPGARSKIELGPSIQQRPLGDFISPVKDEMAVDVDIGHVLGSGQIRFDNDLPEEGGRFFRSSVRHRIIELSPETDDVAGASGHWLTLGQIQKISAETPLASIELRSLLACIPIDFRCQG